MQEQRRSDRRAATLRVEVKEHREGKSFAFDTQDVSAEGLFLVVKKPRSFHLGQTVTLRLHVPGREEPVRAAAEVVRICDKAWARAHGGPTGVGVEFVEPQQLL